MTTIQQRQIERRNEDAQVAGEADVTAERDPVGALSALGAAFAIFEAGPFELNWRRVTKAYADLIFHTERSRRRELWRLARSGVSDLAWLVRYGSERDRRYTQTHARKESKRKYDAKNAKSPARQAQIKRARAQYKKKVEKGEGGAT